MYKGSRIDFIYFSLLVFETLKKGFLNNLSSPIVGHPTLILLKWRPSLPNLAATKGSNMMVSHKAQYPWWMTSRSIPVTLLPSRRKMGF